MKIDWTIVMLALYIAGSLCFLGGSVVALWKHLA